MTRDARLTLLALRLGVSVAVVGCDRSDEADFPAAGIDAGMQESAMPVRPLRLVYDPMYAALVEGHPAQLPVTLHRSYANRQNARYSSADPSIAEVVPTTEGAMITAKKEGKVSILVELDTRRGSAVLTIKKYTEAEWLRGEARYNAPSRALSSADGGRPRAIDLITSPSTRNASGACSTCHSAKAEILNIEDTPMQTAGYSDEELLAIITKGQRPDWVERPMSPQFAWGEKHAWTVSDEDQRGLIAYLRTKEPKPQPSTGGGGGGGGLYICGDAGPNAMPLLCNQDGDLIPLPTRPGAGDAGAPRTLDAGMYDGGS